jgi:hypothetical protein
MNTFRAAVCALLFAGTAFAHPVVLEEVATLSPPDPSWQDLGRIGVAIDGDFALVTAERNVPDPYEETGFRWEMAAFVYQRSGTSWNYTSQLGPIVARGDRSTPGIAMKGGIAVVSLGLARIYERAGTAWTEAALPPGTYLAGTDVEIDAGRILVSNTECSPTAVVLRKINGQWAVEGELAGYSHNCDYGPWNNQQDIQGEFAVVHDPASDSYPSPPHVRQYRRNENGIGWREFGGIAPVSFGPYFTPDVAIAGGNVAFTGTRERGTSIAYPTNDAADPAYALATTGLQAPDSYLEPDEWSATGLERVGTLFAQRNYSFDRKAYVFNLFRVNDDEAHTNTLVATLQTKSGLSIGDLLDASGNYIIVNEPYVYGNRDTRVRIYQLPASFEQPDVQVHDFESPSAGAAWQPGAGSTFSTVVARTTHVYRQASTAGKPYSYLPTSTAANQSIQSELIIRALDGSGAWAGLMTRRDSDADYYYAVLRNTGVVELGRRVNGVPTTLASTPISVATGRKYRLRLESMATTHRVYLEDALVLVARDSALVQGDAGIIMNRAAVDYDNVIVTPGPLTTIFRTNFPTTASPGAWTKNQGQWQSVGGVFKQSDSAGYGRAVIGARTDDQIVQARIRPLSFADPDNWVGLMARYHDDRNHLFVTLRGRGVISLWRRSNGLITQLATRSLPVSIGTWYRVRVEVVNGLTRVFVDNQLQLSSSADPGPAIPGYSDSKGQVGLITYKATADFDDVVAYQP